MTYMSSCVSLAFTRLGGCDDCPENSRCREGFCECLLGYVINQKLCTKGELITTRQQVLLANYFTQLHAQAWLIALRLFTAGAQESMSVFVVQATPGLAVVKRSSVLCLIAARVTGFASKAINAYAILTGEEMIVRFPLVKTCKIVLVRVLVYMSSVS